MLAAASAVVAFPTYVIGKDDRKFQYFMTYMGLLLLLFVVLAVGTTITSFMRVF